MKARIKTNGKIVEVISRFMPRKRNAASRDWVCNLSDGTCIDESQLEYTEEPVEGLEEAAWDCVLDSIDVNNPVLLPKYKELLTYLFKAGAEWGMNQCPLPEDTTIFLKGVAEGKRLMMEEAVEGRYMKAAGRVYVESWPLDIVPDLVKSGDEVKIIIVKENEK